MPAVGSYDEPRPLGHTRAVPGPATDASSAAALKANFLDGEFLAQLCSCFYGRIDKDLVEHGTARSVARRNTVQWRGTARQ
jgi:hypothetical protein